MFGGLKGPIMCLWVKDTHFIDVSIMTFVLCEICQKGSSSVELLLQAHRKVA